MIKEHATLNLNNFLSSYTLEESTTLLNEVIDQVSNTINGASGNLREDDMLDFLEALEELIPAVYGLNKR